MPPCELAVAAGRRGGGGEVFATPTTGHSVGAPPDCRLAAPRLAGCSRCVKVPPHARHPPVPCFDPSSLFPPSSRYQARRRADQKDYALKVADVRALGPEEQADVVNEIRRGACRRPARCQAARSNVGPAACPLGPPPLLAPHGRGPPVGPPRPCQRRRRVMCLSTFPAGCWPPCPTPT